VAGDRQTVRPGSPTYLNVEPLLLLFATDTFSLVLLTIDAVLLQATVLGFVASFTILIWLAYVCWVFGSYAYIAVTTPGDMQRFGIGWSLRLTNKSGYVIALLFGVAIANPLPALAAWLGAAARPELYIKTAIVILGGTAGVKAAEQLASPLR
jgi:hypothetical protein